MRNKKIIGILITIAVVITAIMIAAVIITIYLDESNNYDERTREEYSAILLDNKEDFDYVAKMMQQWTHGSIDFDKGISSIDQEIADEISNNEEFYGHLKNLYDLNEIDYILIEGEEIAFYFSKFPTKYHGGVFYGENDREEDNIRRKIEDHWMLYMIPDV